MKFATPAALAAVLTGLAPISFAVAGQSPNYYECAGKNTSLTLIVGSEAEVGILPPQTSLNLQLGKQGYAFTGKELGSQSTVIGELWTAKLGAIPDRYSEYASVVIPSVSLAESPIGFKSQLILTRVASPLDPQSHIGVVNPSRYIDINCTASFVYY